MIPTPQKPEDREGALSNIPTPLHEKIIQLRPILERQGTLQRRVERARRPSFRIRYRDHDFDTGSERFQKSLNLGADEDVVEAVWRLVETWRAERQIEPKIKMEQELTGYSKKWADLVCSFEREKRPVGRPRRLRMW